MPSTNIFYISKFEGQAVSTLILRSPWTFTSININQLYVLYYLVRIDWHCYFIIYSEQTQLALGTGQGAV